MNKVIILVMGLVIGLASGIGVNALLKKAGSDEMAQMKTQIAELDKKITNTTTEENKLRQKLADTEKEKTAYQAQIADLQKELATAIKPEITKEPPDKKPEEKGLINKDDLRKYAKGAKKFIELKEQGSSVGAKIDPETEKMLSSLIQFHSDIMRILNQNKINWTSSLDVFRVPEVRQVFAELEACIFEEIGLPLSDVQKAKIIENKELIHKEAEKLNDESLSALEEYIMTRKISDQACKRIQDILTNEQYQKSSHFLDKFGSFAMEEDMFTNASYRIINERDRVKAVDQLLEYWAGALELNDTEKQCIKPVADRYISDNIVLKKTLERENGKEFMDYYLGRAPNDEAEKESFEGKQREYMKNNPDFYKKCDIVNMQFLELQLKYQKEIALLLPTKEELIKKQGPCVEQFPYLE